jgi:hypothetical protein
MLVLSYILIPLEITRGVRIKWFLGGTVSGYGTNFTLICLTFLITCVLVMDICFRNIEVSKEN